MKKFLSLLLAIIIGLFSATVRITDTVTVDRPTENKIAEWAIGYGKRCRGYIGKIQPRNWQPVKRFARRVALMPLTLLLGSTYVCSYVDKNGQRQSHEFDNFCDARIALTKIQSFKDKSVAKTGIIHRKDEDGMSAEDKARASEAGLIRKINLVAGTEEYIPMSRSSLKRKLAKIGEIPFDAVMKINCSANEKEEAEYAGAICQVQRITADAYVDKKGCRWVPLLASASDKRKGTFLAIRADLAPKMSKWLLGGIPTKYLEMVVSKYLVYMGLQTSTSKPVEEVFSESIDFNRIAVIDDMEAETMTSKIVLFVTKTLNVIRKLAHKEPLNVFDGLGIYFEKGKMNKAFSGRFGIMTKFLLIPQKRSEWIKELKARKLEPVVRQFDGTTMKLDDIDIILTKSCFKGTALFKTVAEWRKACIDNEYECSVCIQQHTKQLKSMPYQQGQLLKGSAADAMGLVSHAIASVQKWSKPEEAARIIGGWFGACCAIYPALLKTRIAQLRLQERYKQHRAAMIAGKVPDVGYSVFVAPDPKAFFCHVFKIPLEFQMEEDEAIFSWAKDGENIVLTRNPDTDGCPIVKAKQHGWGCYDGIIYIHPLSWIPILLRLDYDGDHLLVVTDPLVVKLFEQTFQLIDKFPIVWEAPKGQKTKINKSTISEAIIASITGSKVGFHSDNITKLWNISKEDRQKLEELYGEDVIEELIAIETRNVNVDIDSTKNAGDDSKPEIITQKKISMLRNLPLPQFCRYSKADDETPAESEYWDKKCRYTGSLLDIYSRTVMKRLPEKLELKGLEDEVFDCGNLLHDPKRPLTQYRGLAVAGSYDLEREEYTNEGLFNNISFRHMKEKKELLGKDVKLEDFNDAVKESALAEIKRYVETFGGTEEGAYDIIVRWTMLNTDMLKDPYVSRISSEIENLYGEKMFNTLCLNVCAPDNEIPYYDEDENE